MKHLIDVDRFLDRLSRHEGVINLKWFENELRSEPLLTIKDIEKVLREEEECVRLEGEEHATKETGET